MAGVDLTKEQQQFVSSLIREAAPVAVLNLVPPSALLACACAESGYGTSDIYKVTGCPFNLQKPDHYTWLDCDVVKLDTKGSEVDKKIIKVNFCKARNLGHAAAIWCAWILNWPYKPNRERLLKARGNGAEFARLLPWVGFGTQHEDWRKKNGDKFAQVRADNGFAAYDLPVEAAVAAARAAGRLLGG